MTLPKMMLKKPTSLIILLLYLVSPLVPKQLPRYKYYLESSNFYDAWEIQKCEGEATVVILDSGFDLDPLIANFSAQCLEPHLKK